MGTQFNYNKLKGRIVEKLGSQTALATQMGISAITLTQKLKGRVAFKTFHPMTFRCIFFAMRIKFP